MSKNLAIFCMILTAIFGCKKVQTVETYSFFLQREDGTFLEGYFSPPNQADSPIIFAIQGSSCESVLQWYTALCNRVTPLEAGVNEKIDFLTYRQTNSLQQRQEDYELCLENMHRICPGWTGKFIFWGASEGGMLAAHLASQTPQTAAVLLFGTGGGMKPREEVKWVIRHRLEEQKALQSEIDAYMSFLDEQMDAMMLDPTPNKEFLGNTYKWWDSFLYAEEIVNSLNQKSLPIFLFHGVEDNKIPISSADLAAEALKESDALTYLRLQGYGHDLDTAEIHEAAYHWLASVLSGKKHLDNAFIVQTDPPKPVLLENSQTDNMSDYIFSRGKDENRDSNDRGEERGEVYGSGRASRDLDGNQSYSFEGGIRYRSENNWEGSVSAGASSRTDRNGNTRGEAHVEARGSKKF